MKKFSGLNNVTDPMRMGWSWLVQADNVDVTETGGLRGRAGYTQALAGSAIAGAYATQDGERLYFVDSGVLKAMDSASSAHAIRTGLGGGPYHWAEVNGDVYYTNGVDSGIIGPDHEWSAWSGSDRTDEGDVADVVLGARPYSAIQARSRYTEENCSPLPNGCGPIAEFKGRMHAAMPIPNLDQTVIWQSKPLGYSLFDLAKDYIIVPGKVCMLASTDEGLVIGTDAQVLAYDGNSLKAVADYGVVPGQHWDRENAGTVLFWSVRGLCRALPFANLTERQVSVAPGVQAGGAIVRRQGRESYIVSIQQGGSAFNQF